MDKQLLQALQQLNKRMTSIEKNMVTKADAKGFATKDDLKAFATKDDLNVLKKELMEYSDGWFSELLVTVNNRKADIEEVEEIKKRVARLEN